MPTCSPRALAGQWCEAFRYGLPAVRYAFDYSNTLRRAGTALRALHEPPETEPRSV